MTAHIPFDSLWLTYGAVALEAAAAVLAAGKKRFDLFGMIFIALAAALGGGSLRDMLLGRPVFWVVNQFFLAVALVAALLTFFLARRVRLSDDLFLLPDAAGLALFTMIGAKAAWFMDAPWLVASFMGVITGVMGGVFRDVLCNEEPVVFRGPLYATAAWAGALFLIGLFQLGVDSFHASLAAGAFIFVLRLAAMRWEIGLPHFRHGG